jgi:branched-chain amino acid transport system substrate-binding protein
MRYSPLIGLFCLGLFLNGVADAQSPSGVVRIGILNDQSGPYADFGGKTSVDAARMAVEDVGGKVLGKSIEMIIGDHQNKPDVDSAIARRWFDVDGVGAVAELTNSAVALAVRWAVTAPFLPSREAAPLVFHVGKALEAPPA